MKIICQNDNCRKEFNGSKERKFCCLQCCWEWRKDQEELPGTFKKGQSSWNKGKECPQETRDKVSKSKRGKPVPKLQGRIFTPEWKERLSEAHSNRSQEWKDNLSAANKGRVHPPEFGQQISKRTKGEKNPFYGKHHTQESKDKVSIAKTGVKLPAITGENHPMFKHPEKFLYKGRGKGGYREDLGIYVRSSWEANILRIFNHLGFHVEYEPKHFSLSDGSTYTPDFYVRETDEFIEVKGLYSSDSKKKVELFKSEYPGLAFSMIFEKEYSNYLKEFKQSGVFLEGIN